MARKKSAKLTTQKPDAPVLSARVIDPVMQQFSNFLSFMPNPDLLLAKTGQPLTVYREMLLDGKIASLIDIRKCAVLEHPRYLKPADDTPRAKEIADCVEQCYDELNDYSDLKDLLSALDFGFSIGEVIWGLYDGQWWPDKIEYRKQERFGFLNDFSPFLLQDGLRRPLTDPCKFMVHRNGNSTENPYGTSVLAACYWPWQFKRAGWQFWMQAADKFGCPSVMALFECSDPKEAQTRANTIAGLLAGIRSDSGLALANVKEVKALEMSGSVDGFKTLIECANAEISYAITGQSLATGESQYGTRSQGEVHERIIDVFTRSDARALAYTENSTLVKWIVLLNFGPDAPVPRWEYDFEDDAPWETVRDAIDRNVPVSREKLYSRYKIPQPKDEADIFLRPAGSPAAGILNFADAVAGGNPGDSRRAAQAQKDDDAAASLQDNFIDQAAEEYAGLIDSVTKSLGKVAQ